MKWKKKGLIYCATGEFEWNFQWAMLPTPILLEKKTLRIYLGFCDEEIVGRVGYVDVNPDNPSEITAISKTPVLNIGRDGCFDDNGVVPISILRKNEAIYLYYIGFQLGKKVPYYMFCGLAISYDNGNTFKRYSESPILDRINSEVYARCGVNVIKDDNKYKMWYIGSNKEGWTENNGTYKPLYIMKYTESSDGIHWHEDSITCLDYKNEDEHGFGRPYVWKQNNIYRMLYSIRTFSKGYYIGYAESKDGIQWDRKDNLAGISLSVEGWDSENLSYPFIFKHGDKTYLFYNGNGCGKTGFGYAELVDD